MRSWRSLLPATFAFVLGGACGNDTGIPPGPDPDPEPDPCETSFLDYGNFGAPFVANWCRGCHSSAVPEAGRQNAPIDVNFDNAMDVDHWRERIKLRATGDVASMPPAGGPSSEERALLGEWLDCGMK